MAGTRRLSELAGTASARLALPDGELVVALSGGADSAALAYLCSQLGRAVACLHVNHGLAASPMMQSAAEAIAGRLGLPLRVREVTVPEGPSPEGQARRARYSAFADIDGALLTAHTRDDNVETVVFNMIRGAGAKGLAGIPYHRPRNIYRPMLAVSRSETRETAALAGLPFADDPMNADLSLTRGFIRSRIIPVMSEVNPKLADSISRLAATAASDNSHLDREAARVGILQDGGVVAAAVGRLTALPEPVRDRVLARMLSHAIGPAGVTAERVSAMWAVAEGRVGRRQIRSDLAARLQGPMLVIESPQARRGAATVTLTPGHHHREGVEFEVVAVNDRCRTAPLSRWAAVFRPDAALAAGPDGWVTADGERAWKPGERRLPVAWYDPGSVGYLSVVANETAG